MAKTNIDIDYLYDIYKKIAPEAIKKWNLERKSNETIVDKVIFIHMIECIIENQIRAKEF